jgi:hypothetical protein
MRVKTPAIKLEVTLEQAELEDGDIKFSGLAGVMNCDTYISPKEVWGLIRLCLKPSIAIALLKAVF